MSCENNSGRLQTQQSLLLCSVVCGILSAGLAFCGFTINGDSDTVLRVNAFFFFLLRALPCFATMLQTRLTV